MKNRILRTPEDLKRCANSILGLEQYLPIKVGVDNYKPTRSNEQSRKMYAMLDDLSDQVVLTNEGYKLLDYDTSKAWYQRLSRYDWKNVCSAVLKGQKSFPGINGGFVICGYESSKMTVPEMMDMITLIEAFGAEHDVEFKEI